MERISMRELKFRNKIRKLVKGKWSLIETSTEAGIPDAVWSFSDVPANAHEGCTFFIEFKVNYSGRVTMKREQWAWNMEQNKHHTNSFLVIDFGDDDQILVFRTDKLRLLNNVQTMNQKKAIVLRLEEMIPHGVVHHMKDKDLTHRLLVTCMWE